MHKHKALLGACLVLFATASIALCGLQATRVKSPAVWIVGVVAGIGTVVVGFRAMMRSPIPQREAETWQL
jgi:hypothetical protein